MSHSMHVTDPSFLVYQLYVPPTKKKPAAKANRIGDALGYQSVNGRNRDADDSEPDDRDAENDDSGRGRGFDFTV